MFPIPEVPKMNPDLVWERRVIPSGTHLDAWIAGPVVPVWVHWSGTASKPCVHRMTSGALPCKDEDCKASVRIIGYLPVIQKHSQRLVLILSHQATYEAQGLHHGECYRFSRGPGKRDRVKIGLTPRAEVSPQLTGLFSKRPPADIRPWLLNLWRDTRLTNHFAPVVAEQSNDPEHLCVNSELVGAALANRDMLAIAAPSNQLES
jgi:hypothetical protein